MLAVLVMTACTTAGGIEYCQPIVLSPVVRMTECYTQAQPSMARWLGEHPAYRHKGFKCADPREVASILGRTQA